MNIILSLLLGLSIPTEIKVKHTSTPLHLSDASDVIPLNKYAAIITNKRTKTRSIENIVIGKNKISLPQNNNAIISNYRSDIIFGKINGMEIISVRNNKIIKQQLNYFPKDTMPDPIALFQLDGQDYLLTSPLKNGDGKHSHSVRLLPVLCKLDQYCKDPMRFQDHNDNAIDAIYVSEKYKLMAYTRHNGSIFVRSLPDGKLVFKTHKDYTLDGASRGILILDQGLVYKTRHKIFFHQRLKQKGFVLDPKAKRIFTESKKNFLYKIFPYKNYILTILKDGIYLMDTSGKIKNIHPEQSGYSHVLKGNTLFFIKKKKNKYFLEKLKFLKP